MKRTAFDENRDRQVAEQYLGDFMACSLCKAMTDRNELGVFGARCKPCFDAYCAEANSPNPPRTPQQRAAIRARAKEVLSQVGGITSDQAATVARRLRALEAAGMRLTDGQQWVLERCEAKASLGQSSAGAALEALA